jgi:para-aminobenzoate synthetase/4-amino-4-deoxychorismate lyase
MSAHLKTGRFSSPHHSLPAADLLAALGDSSPFLLFETALLSPEENRSLLFVKPERIVTTNRPERVQDCLADLENSVKAGLWAAGWLSYELGYFLEPSLRPRYEGGRPLLWFGLFREPAVFDHRTGIFSPSLPFLLPEDAQAPPHTIEDAGLNVSRGEYRRSVDEIKERIAAGDTYQVNYTMKYGFRFSGSPSGLYLSLRDNQPVSFAAFLRTGERDILSASPELFFRCREREITVRPMKGTAPRGLSGREDLRRAIGLSRDPKNRAENIMVVDLLRNDLGKICLPGTIEVSDLCRVEPYDTLFQMTSTVRGRLREGAGPVDILQALFPSGSVTGAPKIRTMEIIAGLEKDERGPYCGAIGFFSPRGESVFNVPIRTVLIEGRRGEMGLGSGIVADSDADAEYEECLLKGRFLTRPRDPLRLIETLRWQEDQGFTLMEEHLARLLSTALRFGFAFPLRKIRRALDDAASGFGKDVPQRVRLLLSRDGVCEVSSSPLHPPPSSPRVLLSGVQMNSSDPHLYHKTTRREVYDRELEAARKAGIFEVLFSNEKGELTEGSFTNVFLQLNGRLVTPPVSCGLLDGVLRHLLLRENPDLVSEGILTPDDLEKADRLFVGNSVRGLVEVHLADGGK